MLTEDGECVVSIMDTGIGMTAEGIELAQQPFGQVDGALNRRFEGTGLGLPLSKALIELHGGQLTIESVPQKARPCACICRRRCHLWPA